MCKIFVNAVRGPLVVHVQEVVAGRSNLKCVVGPDAVGGL